MSSEFSSEQPRPAMEMMKFPRDKDKYDLLAVVATSDVASIYKAKAKYENPVTEITEEIPVGIKTINLSKIKDIYFLTKEVHDAKACNHENLVKVHCSFKNKNELWIIMPPLSGFSLRSVIRSSFSHGLPENNVGFILKETLKALDCMHGKNKLHENIGADCIFMDEISSNIKLAFSSIKYELSGYQDGYPVWMMAPELINDHKQLDTKATDVWTFGLLGLELFYGRVPADGFKEFQLLVEGIENCFGPSKNGHVKGPVGSSSFLEKFSCFNPKEKRIPKAMGEVLAACLCRDSSKRATTGQLMGLKFFQKCNAGPESLAKLKKAFKHI